jgi:hypothetical protein
MKRSVAILGRTPQFVRWAIGHACALRELDVENLPDGTFRQLRGLREYSTGLIENRVFENVCVHPASSLEEAEHARGFHANEVLDAHGDAVFVESCCRSCPANAVAESRPGTWSGCYGWLPASSGFCIDSKLRGGVNPNDSVEQQSYKPGRIDFVQLINDLIENSASAHAGELFTTTHPRWYGIWLNSTLNCQQVEFLHDLFHQAVSRCHGIGADPEEFGDLIQFRDALMRCIENRLTLHIDLVPSGYSDGQTWTLVAHCPDCKLEMSESGQQHCSSCGRIGSPHGKRKSKVLGLRPYVNLVGVMGKTMTAKFMARFESRSSPKLM